MKISEFKMLTNFNFWKFWLSKLRNFPKGFFFFFTFETQKCQIFTWIFFFYKEILNFSNSEILKFFLENDLKTSECFGSNCTPLFSIYSDSNDFHAKLQAIEHFSVENKLTGDAEPEVQPVSAASVWHLAAKGHVLVVFGRVKGQIVHSRVESIRTRLAFHLQRRLDHFFFSGPGEKHRRRVEASGMALKLALFF